jgi:hypothetical protein
MSRCVIPIIWHKSNIVKNHDEIVQCSYMLSSSCNQDRFPNPGKYPERFSDWLKRIDNTQLITLDSWKVYNNHHTVCGLHFENHYFAANNKLKNTAVPTLRIPYSKFNDIYIKCRVLFCFFRANIKKPTISSAR